MEEWAGEGREWMLDLLREEFESPRAATTLEANLDAYRILVQLHQRMSVHPGGSKSRILGWRHKWIAAAACIAAGIFGLTYFWLSVQEGGRDVSMSSAASVASDIAPGVDRALLVLPGGRTIALDSNAHGALDIGSHTLDVSVQDGGIRYAGSAGHPGDVGGSLMHAIVTPRGGQYRVTLSDGTVVWLNAASSIRYPAMFSGSERRVEISGEAYLEVAYDAGRPFFVDADGRAIVRVTGTRFNVNAYRDETSLDITLVEGSVSVGRMPEGPMTVLSPGLQASLSAAGAPFVHRLDDLDRVMAWKEGKFQFGDGVEIGSVMRQLARWYNVEIRYEGTVRGMVGGGISRRVNLSRVLEMIAMTGIARFTTDGRIVRVFPPALRPGHDE